jgi:hypothetical protein
MREHQHGLSISWVVKPVLYRMGDARMVLPFNTPTNRDKLSEGGLRANARREVLDWDDTPIPRLYAAGEICSVFQFVYQGGGNLAECIVFGRIAGKNAAEETPLA